MSGHGWTHALCRPCFGALQPGREPFTIREEYREEEVCCRCMTQTRSGIYYRADPRELGCGPRPSSRPPGGGTPDDARPAGSGPGGAPAQRM